MSVLACARWDLDRGGRAQVSSVVLMIAVPLVSSYLDALSDSGAVYSAFRYLSSRAKDHRGCLDLQLSGQASLSN